MTIFSLQLQIVTKSLAAPCHCLHLGVSIALPHVNTYVSLACYCLYDSLAYFFLSFYFLMTTRTLLSEEQAWHTLLDERNLHVATLLICLSATSAKVQLRTLALLVSASHAMQYFYFLLLKLKPYLHQIYDFAYSVNLIYLVK